MNIGFWLSLIFCYGAIAFAFILLMMGANKIRKEQECKRNHPAGRLAKIAPLPTGQISETSHQDYNAPMSGAMIRAYHMQAD